MVKVLFDALWTRVGSWSSIQAVLLLLLHVVLHVLFIGELSEQVLLNAHMCLEESGWNLIEDGIWAIGIELLLGILEHLIFVRGVLWRVCGQFSALELAERVEVEVRPVIVVSRKLIARVVVHGHHSRKNLLAIRERLKPIFHGLVV